MNEFGKNNLLFCIYFRSLFQPEMDLKWVISEEERTRHDALFYSQKPKDQYLSGEKCVMCESDGGFDRAHLCKYFFTFFVIFFRWTGSFFVHTIQTTFTGAQ